MKAKKDKKLKRTNDHIAVYTNYARDLLYSKDSIKQREKFWINTCELKIYVYEAWS